MNATNEPGTALAPSARPDLWIALALAVVAAALRLPGLGRAGFAVDEYYTWQSVSFILEHGVPRFPDGGFYQRGILVQYLMALPMGLLGRTEFAARLVPCLAGVATVPVLYLLARKVVERPWALTAATVLAFSSWHIELSRFARFYAPFQLLFLVFAAFVVHALTTGRSGRATRAIVGLAVLSPLVYEGGVIVCALFGLTLLYQDRPWERTGRRIVVGTAALVAWNYLISGVSLRFLGESANAVAESAGRTGPGGVRLRLPVLTPEIPLLRRVPDDLVATAGWIVVVAVLAVATVVAVRRSRGFWTAFVLSAAAGALALQQVGLFAAMVAVASLARIDVRRSIRPAWLLACAVAAVYWIVLALVTEPELLRFPGAAIARIADYGAVVDNLLAPFGAAVPAWSVGIAALASAASVHVLRQGRPHDPLAAVLVLAAASLAIVPIFRTTFTSSRYVFFAFPLVLIAAVAGARASTRVLSRNRTATAVGCAVVLALFVASEDFHSVRLRGAWPVEVQYRTGPYLPLWDHWYGREDYRSPARYVRDHAGAADEVVVDAVTATAYLDRGVSVYVPHWQVRYDAVARMGGARELWTGGPLLDEPEDIARLVRDHGRAWLIATRNRNRWRTFRDDPVTELRRLGVNADEVARGVDGQASVFVLTPVEAAAAPRGRPLPMICGPGDPEGFLYLEPEAPGATAPQDRIVRILEETGANGMYVIAVRSHGGDGGADENPFVDPADPTSGLDGGTLDRWHRWLSALDRMGVVTSLFLYDDSTDPFRGVDPGPPGEAGGSPPTTSAESGFVDGLVARFSDLDRLVWVVAEEYDEAISKPRTSAIARRIRDVHPGEPWVGVHQRPDVAFDFADDPAVDVFLMQWGDDGSSPDDLHRAVTEARVVSRNRYQVLMSEIPFGGTGDDDAARRKVWAMAMAGAGVLVNGWDVLSTPPERLRECGDLVRWFDGLSPSELDGDDASAAGDTVYVLRGPDGERLLYAADGQGPLGVRDVPPGRYRIAWLHPPTGRTADGALTWEGGERVLVDRPDGFGGEAALRLTPER